LEAAQAGDRYGSLLKIARRTLLFNMAIILPWSDRNRIDVIYVAYTVAHSRTMTKRIIGAHTARSVKSIGKVAVMVDNIDLTKLPPPDTNRWVVSRKAAVVHAVRDGSISLQEACQRYTLSIEEFLAWERAVDRYGIPGLRATRMQIYRDTDKVRATKASRASAASPNMVAAASF
jgi:Protein of unknown function (DUF1153)